jgi:hypothetical protein
VIALAKDSPAITAALRAVPVFAQLTESQAALLAAAGVRRKVLERCEPGRSKGGLSTKIHLMVDALGNPLAFFLTGGQAHNLQGADALLPQVKADTVLADKAFDVDERVIELLLAAGKTAVIPPKSSRKERLPSGRLRDQPP